MRLFLPDVMATFTLQGQPVAKAAINAKADLEIVTASNADSAISIQLGKPDIEVDVLPDIANQTDFTNADLSKAVELSLDDQITSISALLGSIPIPTLGGLQMKNVSVTSDDGYLMMKGTLR
jgi:hypothetical protein